MSQADVLLMIDEIVEAPAGTVSMTDTLKEIPNWDSMAIIVFQAEADERLGLTVEPVDLAKCQTVGDLVGLLGVAA